MDRAHNCIKLVAAVEQHLEGPVTDKDESRSSFKQEAQVRQQVEANDLSSRHSKQHCLDLSDLGRVTGECWGPVGPRPSFEETLVRFGPLLDFDTLVEEGVPRRS
jgi:hypothetical protein